MVLDQDSRHNHQKFDFTRRLQRSSQGILCYLTRLPALHRIPMMGMVPYACLRRDSSRLEDYSASRQIASDEDDANEAGARGAEEGARWTWRLLISLVRSIRYQQQNDMAFIPKVSLLQYVHSVSPIKLSAVDDAASRCQPPCPALKP
jgi:hypothetical protein